MPIFLRLHFDWLGISQQCLHLTGMNCFHPNWIGVCVCVHFGIKCSTPRDLDKARARMEVQQTSIDENDPCWANNCDLHAIRFHSQINEWVMNVLEIQICSIEMRFAFGYMQCSHRKFKWATLHRTCVTHIFDQIFKALIWSICVIETERVKDR